MEKITLSIHNARLKKQIKAYAKNRSLTISGIVENYLQNLIKIEKEQQKAEYDLPVDLDALLDGIEVSEKLKSRSYKSLRDEMYDEREV